MAGKNTVLLSITGEGRDLSKELSKAGQATDDFAKDVSQASDKASRKLDQVAQSADSIKPVDIAVKVDTGKGKADLDELDKAGKNVKPVKVPVKVEDSGVKDRLSEIGDVGADAFSGGFVDALKGGGLVAGIAAVISSGLDAVTEQKNLVADIQNSMGISENDAQDYGTRIGKAYASGLGESKGQIAEVYSTLSSDVKDWANLTEDAQDRIAGRQTKIVDAAFADTQQSIAAVSSAYTNKLVPSFESAQDLLVTGYQILGSRGDDWAETLQEYSGQFHDLGIEGGQALGLIKQGLEAGARDTDFVADIWKEVGIRVIDTAKTTKDALKDLFKDPKLNVDEFQKTIASGGPPAEAALEKLIGKLQAVKDPVEKNRLGVLLFGTQYEDTFKRVIDSTDLAKAKMTDYQGATDKLVSHQRTLTEQIGQLWDNVNLKVGSAIDFANQKQGEMFTSNSVLDGSLSELGQKFMDSDRAANNFGISLDGTNRGITRVADNVGGFGSPAFADLITKMDDSQLAALGVTVKLDGLGHRVLTMPEGKPIIIDTNSGKVISDLNAVQRRVDTLPKQGFFTYFIDTVVRGPGPGSLNSLNAVLGGGHAAGGWVQGVGGPQQDNILTPSSVGEFYVQSSEAGKWGPQLEALNAGKSWMEAGGYGGRRSSGGGGGAVATVRVAGSSDSAVATLVQTLLNRGLIQITT